MDEKEVYCEDYLQHKGSDLIGDNHVFLCNYGEILMCDNYQCEYRNNSDEKLLIEGEKPEVGVCLSKGLKKIVEVETEEFKGIETEIEEYVPEVNQ